MFKIIEPEEMLAFIKSRRSIRNFQDKSISDKDIEMILEAGRWAPSASNKQPWEFIVIKDRTLLKEISKSGRYSKFARKAPIGIAIVGKISENPKWYIKDTTLVSMNMMLMAWSLNIGTCWLGSMDREKVKGILGLGKDDSLLTVLPLGYIKGKIPEPTPRKDLNKIKREIK